MELRGASFSWDGSTARAGGAEEDEEEAKGGFSGLLDLDLGLRPGELCCVVGPVGGGKSSLVAAVLGQMALVAGDRKVRARSVALCPQEPFRLSNKVNTRHHTTIHSIRIHAISSRRHVKPTSKKEPWILSRELWANVALDCDTRDQLDTEA